MSKIFQNKIALITGASRGLGRAVAKNLAKNEKIRTIKNLPVNNLTKKRKLKCKSIKKESNKFKEKNKKKKENKKVKFSLKKNKKIKYYTSDYVGSDSDSHSHSDDSNDKLDRDLQDIFNTTEFNNIINSKNTNSNNSNKKFEIQEMPDIDENSLFE